jgi:hypothetical protein
MGTGMTTKTPTASVISRLLTTAGFEKSESSATRVRGWRNHSPGYVIRRGDAPGEVKVYYETGTFRTEAKDRQHRAERETEYADLIEGAGYAVLRQEGGAWAPLVVTTKTEA